MNNAASRARHARCYLRARHHGVLSTLSRRVAGYPYGLVVPFTLDHEARPIILVSRLAEPTRNLEADGRASLIVRDDGDGFDVRADGVHPRFDFPETAPDAESVQRPVVAMVEVGHDARTP